MTSLGAAEISSRSTGDRDPYPPGDAGGRLQIATSDRERWEGARPAAVRAASLALAALAAWFVLFAAFFSSLQEHGSQARLYAMYRSQLANETAPYQAPIPAGDPVALISIGRLGINHMVIVEGTTSRQLADGPGHEIDTPLPGQVGTSVVMGRRLTYGGPFSGIGALREGDQILVTTAQGVFHYRVEDVGHPATTRPSPVAPGAGRLTLITSSGGWLGPLTPAGAVYVDAVLASGGAQPVPAPLPSLTSAARPMQGDRSALVPLIFWLEGLAAAAALVALGWWRWGRWQTWLVGLPVILATCWGVSDSLMQFLPNLT